MDDQNPRGHTPSHAARGGRPSRRWFLVGGGAIALAGGGGIAAGLLLPGHRSAHPPTPKRPPRELIAALAAEQELLAAVTAAVQAGSGQRTVLAQLRRDHAAHLTALQAALAPYERATRAATTAQAPSGPVPVPADRAALRAAERTASVRAAVRARGLTGQDATLLASIAACEATHVELLA